MKIYGASKLKYAPLWRKLRQEWIEHEFTNTWIDTYLDAGGGTLPDICRTAWIKNVEDVLRADCVLLFAGYHDELLRGAILEAGVAIGAGRQVIVTGLSSSYGSWQFHPAVIRIPTLDNVREFLRENPNR